MADILNSALTGDADFAGSIFNTPTQEAPPETPQNDQVQPEQTDDQPEESPKKPVVEDKKAATPEKPVKKTKATKEEAAKAVEEITKKTSTEKGTEKAEVKSEDSSEDDLPINPHFQDKLVADKPEGDDSEKGIQSWKEIKNELKRIREQRDEAVAKLKITEEEGSKISQVEVESFKKEIEDYRTQIAALHQELKAANIERSPEYIENVKKPVSLIQEDLKAIAEANDADFNKLWQALTEPDRRKRMDALEDLTADFKRMEQLSIVKMADNVQELAQRHERYQKEAQTLIEQERAKKAQEEQNFIENDLRLQKTFAAKAWTGMEDRYEFLREVDGQDDWNKHLRNARQAASETNLDRLSVEDRSSILAKAAVIPFLEGAVNHYKAKLEATLESKNAKIAELEEQVKSLVGATPSLGKTSDASDDGPDEDDSSLTNFGASILGRR